MYNVPPIFRNAQQQSQFDADGFLKITLLENSDIEALSALFKKYFPNPSQDFFSSSYENDFLLKKEISNSIGEILLPRLEQIFVNYTWFGSAFLSKGNGQRSEMPMHQDWTIVDETQFIALNIWTPLQQTTEANGTLEVIPGSHHWHDTLRAPTLPFYFNGFQNQIKGYLKPIPTQAGEAIVLNQAVIHYSKPNTTNDIRAAITTGIKTSGAPMIFHYWDKNKPGEIEQFSMDDDFLNSFTEFHQSIFKRPTLGKSLGTKAFTLKNPTQEEVNKLTGLANSDGLPANKASDTIKKSFAKKIIEWIKA